MAISLLLSSLSSLSIPSSLQLHLRSFIASFLILFVPLHSHRRWWTICCCSLHSGQLLDCLIPNLCSSLLAKSSPLTSLKKKSLVRMSLIIFFASLLMVIVSSSSKLPSSRDFLLLSPFFRAWPHLILSIMTCYVISVSMRPEPPNYMECLFHIPFLSCPFSTLPLLLWVLCP